MVAAATLLLTLAVSASGAKGSLSENLLIASEALGYELQYRVYRPDSEAKDLPVLYITDGQWYISQGKMPRLLDKLIGKGRIEPIIAVFVDNRNPHDLSENRRNRQFFCNPDYVRFFTEELVPAIDRDYPSHPHREDRVVLGLSFGALSSACFGLLAHQSFQGIAMQSPAMHPVPEIYEAYSKSPALDLRIFLSTGTIGDNLDQAVRLREVLKKKGYELRYVAVPQGHDWLNWGPLLDDVLEFYFRRK